MNSIKTDIPKKIVWLASYPKSGNTWFRAFLTALLNDGEVDINDMKTDGIFSSRVIFDQCTDLDSTYLYDNEAKLIQPEVFNHLSTVTGKDHLFIKVHDAYTFNQLNEPIIPSEGTKCAIYIIRNPLDVAPSLAKHNDSTIDQAVHLINNKKGTLALDKINKNSSQQFSQLMFDWSGHVESWTTKPDFPVLVIRYEDMYQNPLETFTKAVRFIGLENNEEDIMRAIEASSFDKLKEQETTKKFKETLKPSQTFFNNGQPGNWEKKLTKDHVIDIHKNHEIFMNIYGYKM